MHNYRVSDLNLSIMDLDSETNGFDDKICSETIPRSTQGINSGEYDLKLFFLILIYFVSLADALDPIII